MKYTKLQDKKSNFNPIDIIEDIIIDSGWDFERDSNNNIHVEVGGKWCDYQLSFGHNEEKSIIYISCVLDIKIQDNKIQEVYKLLAEINEKLSLGHFEVWMEDGWPIYRCSIPLPEDMKFCKIQFEKMSIITLQECERFYPAFQFLAWGEKTANDSLKHLMLETQGEV